MSVLFKQGLMLMCIGMGVTFFFLGMLVFCTSVMSRCVQTFWPEKTSEGPDLSIDETSSNPSVMDQRTLTIIQKAIQMHRNKQ